MTKEEHEALWMEHSKLAKEALTAYFEGGLEQEKWEEYKRHHRLANKHFGIMQAIMTKEINKLNRQMIKMTIF